VTYNDFHFHCQYRLVSTVNNSDCITYTGSKIQNSVMHTNICSPQKVASLCQFHRIHGNDKSTTCTYVVMDFASKGDYLLSGRYVISQVLELLHHKFWRCKQLVKVCTRVCLQRVRVSKPLITLHTGIWVEVLMNATVPLEVSVVCEPGITVDALVWFLPCVQHPM